MVHFEKYHENIYLQAWSNAIKLGSRQNNDQIGMMQHILNGRKI